MNAQIKAQWLTALRSGSYTQGRFLLKQQPGGMGNPFTLTALGVLCELAVAAGLYPAWNSNGNNYGYQTMNLPEVVVLWSGLESNRGGYVTIDGHFESIQHHNDGVYMGLFNVNNQKSFAQIANAIEAQL